MKIQTSLLNIAVAVLPITYCDANNDSKIDHERFISPPSRRSSENSTDSCELCVMYGGTLLGDVYPEYDHLHLGIEEGLNCSEISDWIRNSFPYESDGECIDVAVYKFQVHCCWFPIPTPVCEQNVHTFVLGDDRAYNIDVDPLPINKTRTKVNLFFTYYALTEISTIEGTAELFMAIDMDWEDDRLAWDPKDQGGCYFTTFRASSDPEVSEIWVPPFDLGNRADSLQDLPKASARVISDGTVLWNRFGGIKALCFFDGLERFPYDELTCEFDFASTIIYPRVEYSLIDEGIFFYENFNVSRKYQEFEVVSEKSLVWISEDDGLPMCRFYFKRASGYYFQKLIVPTILFTILSFGVFLLDQRVGERLGFGVSVLLVTVAQAILTADTVPVTKEKLWINVLTQGSQYFAVGAVMESLLVAYLYFMKVEPPLGKKMTQDESSENDGECVSLVDESNDPTNTTSNDDYSDNATLSGGNPNVMKSKQASNSAENSGSMTGLSEKTSIVSKLKNFRWTASAIRKMDRVCFRIFPIGYLIFIIYMFASNKSWGT